MGLELIIGCMFAGKSTELLRRFQRLRIVGESCVLVKHREDTRYSFHNVATHANQQIEATIVAKDLTSIFHQLVTYSVIAIDEGHFFRDIGLVDVLANQGKTVIVAAIDQGLHRKPLLDIVSLVAKAEKVDKLSAICCLCKGEAQFSKKIDETDTKNLVGGADKYFSLCRRCYHRQAPRDHPTSIADFNALERERKERAKKDLKSSDDE